MSVNYAELKVIYEELKENIINSVCNKVTQFDNDTVLIEFRKNSKNLPILININSRFNFIGLSYYYQPAPKNPYSFTSTARKYLLNEKVIDIKQIENDRILYIIFSDFQLIIELLGKNGNIFIVDNESTIVGILKARSSEKRKEKIGEKYNPPFGQTQRVFEVREEILRLNKGSFIDNITFYYMKKIAFSKIDESINSLSSELNKIDQSINKFSLELEVEDRNDYKKIADTIIANINTVEDFLRDIKSKKREKAGTITLKDENALILNIELDPDKSAGENAGYYYELSKKKIKKIEQIRFLLAKQTERREETIKKLSEFEKIRSNIENNLLDPYEYLCSIRKKDEKDKDKYQIKSKNTRTNSTVNKAIKEKTKGGSNFNIIQLPSGTTVVAGKSGTGNLEILRKFGKGGFWWFHTRDFQGPFVILLDENLTNIDRDYAATLAVYFSRARNSGKASVIYTRCKHVRPIPGEKGKVIYSNEKEIQVYIDDQSIKQIFSQA